MKFMRGVVLVLALMNVAIFSSNTEAASKKKQKSATARAASSFDTTATRLPKHYKGSDAKIIYQSLMKTLQTLSRDEYETQQEFKERDEKAKLALSNGIAKQQFAGVFELSKMHNPSYEDSRSSTQYDAEAKKLTVHYTKYNEYRKFERRSLWSTFEGNTSYYIGSNAYGASVKVERTKSTSYRYGINDNSIDEDLVFVVDLEPKKAKALNGKLAILFVVSVETPYILGDDYESREPKIDNPYEYSNTIHNVAVKAHEAWLYNYETGEVLTKNKLLNPIIAEIIAETRRVTELRERKLTKEEEMQIAKTQAEQECKKLNSFVTKPESVEADLAEICGITMQIIDLDYKTAPKREQILARYKSDADAIDGWKLSEFESLTDFNARVQIEKDKLESSKQKEIAQLETEANMMRGEVGRIAHKEYMLNASQIQIELGKYEVDHELFPVVLKNKPSTAVAIEITSVIRMTPQRAKSFKTNLEGGQVRPQIKSKVNGEVLKSEIVNDAENYTLEWQKDEFLMPTEHAKKEHDRIIYTDPVTGLMWPRDGNLAGSPMSLYTAMSWASNLSYGGYSDWRLPTKAEFATFANRSWGASRGWFGSNRFSNYECVLYWSAANGSYDGGWNIQEGQGVLEYDGSVKRGPNCVWPVRSGAKNQGLGVYEGMNWDR